MAIQSLEVEAKELWMGPRGSRMATENLDCGGDGSLEHGHRVLCRSLGTPVFSGGGGVGGQGLYYR